MSEQQAEFNGWAKVEVMGHQSHIGFVRTEAYGAAVLFRIDSPGFPEREYVLESPEYACPVESSPDLRSWCPVGTKVKRAARPPVSILVGAGSIYRIIPCTEAVAVATIEREQRAQLIVVALPEGKMLPPATIDDAFENTYEATAGIKYSLPTWENDACNAENTDDSDLCLDCGKPVDLCQC